MYTRWIDLGLTEPEVFHATYQALAESQSRDAPPIVLWAQCQEHVSLGQHQDREAEIDPGVQVPVVRRPVGGGAVWVDPAQHCFVLIVPLAHLPLPPARWFGWGLQPAAATYRRFGLPVELRDRDLWLEGRKIAGSGAATLGASAVFASSFLLGFSAERFARAVACPSEGFREWLAEALKEAMTDWASHSEPPDGQTLASEFRRQCESAFGWTLADSRLGEAEIEARDALLCAPEEKWEWRQSKAVPGGIKLNASMFLTEGHEGGDWARVLTRDGRFARIALSEPIPPKTLARLAACPPQLEALQACLRAALSEPQAQRFARLILETARFES